MPMLRTCAIPGCGTRSFGELCLSHEESSTRHRPLRRHAGLRLLPPTGEHTLEVAGARDAPRGDPATNWLESA